jgi:hypothetical protein
MTYRHRIGMHGDCSAKTGRIREHGGYAEYSEAWKPSVIVTENGNGGPEPRRDFVHTIEL